MRRGPAIPVLALLLDPGLGVAAGIALPHLGFPTLVGKSHFTALFGRHAEHGEAAGIFRIVGEPAVVILVGELRGFVALFAALAFSGGQLVRPFAKPFLEARRDFLEALLPAAVIDFLDVPIDDLAGLAVDRMNVPLLAADR